MADIKTLKEKLVDHLTDQLENPPEDGVPNGVLTTAHSVVKTFLHEIDDKDGEMSVKDEKLRRFLQSSGKSAH